MRMNSRLVPIIAGIAGLTGLGAGVLTLSTRSAPAELTPAVSLEEAAAGHSPVDDWSELTAAQLAVQFAAAMDASPPPSPESIAAATAHAWSFLGDSAFIDSADPNLLRDLLGLFVDLFSIDQRETLAQLLVNDPDAIAAGDHDALVSMYGVLKTLGVGRTERAQMTADWLGQNDWESLAVVPKSELWLWVQDDLGERFDCGIRWTGSITVPSTGEYTFSQLIESKGSAQQMRVSINGQLVLQPDEDNVGDVSTLIELTQNTPVAITVEFAHANEFIDKVEGYPVTMLFWQSDSMNERELVPSNALSPPQGFGDGNGLKGEYFDASVLAVSVLERQDAAIDFAWSNMVFAPSHQDLQDALLEDVWSDLQLADFTGQGGENDGFTAFFRVSSGLNSVQKQQILGWMAASEPLVEQMTAGQLHALHYRTKHAPGDEMTALIGAWCHANPLETEFGAVNDFSAASYGAQTYLPYWRLANSMRTVPWTREARLEENHLLEGDGSCNLAVAYLIATAHRENRTLDTWCDAIDARLEDEQITGDDRAKWLLARAYAEEVRTRRATPWTGREWIELALAENLSASMRQRMIKELVVRVASLDHGDEARSILDSLSQQIGDGNLVAQWHQSIDDVEAVYESARIAAAAEADAAYIARLQERLAAAQDAQDQEQIDRYQQLLDRLTE